MDVNKLEELSCLRLKNDVKEEISKSLVGVVSQLQEISNVKIDNDKEEIFHSTVFREEEFKKPNKIGLNITEDGYFLAPKVIKK